MDHMNLSDELRQQLLENAAWGKAGITPILSEENVEEGSGGAKKLARKGKGGSARAAMRGKAGGDPSIKDDPEKLSRNDADEKVLRSREDAKQVAAGTEHEDAEGSEQLEEAVHVCPLCVSQLDDAIDEERILEHLNVVVGLVDRLSQLQEGDEDIDTVIDETISELLFQDSDEE